MTCHAPGLGSTLMTLAVTHLMVSLCGQAPPRPKFLPPSPAAAPLNAQGASTRTISCNLGRTQAVVERTAAGASTSDLISYSRADLQSGWARTPVVTGLNTAANEQSPFLTPFGDELYFVSDAAGSSDLYVSRRLDDTSVFGPPAPLVGLSSLSAEGDPFVALEELEILFTSDRPGSAGGTGIYRATRSDRSSQWQAPQIIAEVDSPYDEDSPALTRDGLHLFFTSNRPRQGGGLPADHDVYVASRSAVGQAFGAPVLVPELSSSADDVQVHVSFFGTVAYATRDLGGRSVLHEALLNGAVLTGPHDVEIGEALALVALSEPGDAGALALSLGTGSPLQIPGVQGTFDLDLRTLVVPLQGALDSVGALPFTLDVPNDPNLAGLTLHFQSVVASGRGAWTTGVVPIQISAGSDASCSSDLKSCIIGCLGSLPANLVSCAIKKLPKVWWGWSTYLLSVGACVGVSFGSCSLDCFKDWYYCVF